jgi:hypothetical protein
MADGIWMWVVGQVVTAAGIYAAIRADLREALVRVGLLEQWRRDVENRKNRP